MFCWQVQLFDTDAYGIVWHGSYAKWLEYARHHWLQQHGHTLAPPATASVIFPVVEQTLHFKQAARQNDVLGIETQVTLKLPRLVFEQSVVKLPSSGQRLQCLPPHGEASPYVGGLGAPLLLATTTCLLTLPNLKPLRRLPPELAFLKEACL